MLDALAVPGLSGHGVVLLAFTAAVFAVFIWDRFPIASVCLVILVALPLFFLVFPYQTPQGPLEPFSVFAGFGHPALLAICALMILGHALVLTGALEPAARQLSALVARRPGLALLAVMIGAALASGFVNDTPVVVLLIPLLIAATRRAKSSPARLLMPMNYAVLIGGMATTIGTSTNLIVVSMAQELGQPPIGMLDFYPLVAAAAVPAILYLWLLAPRMLGSVESPAQAYSEAVFDADIRVEAESWLDGRTLSEVFEATHGRMRIVDLRARNGMSRARMPDTKLAPDDLILLQDTVENLKEYEAVLKATLHGLPAELVEGEPESAQPEAAKPGERGGERTPAGRGAKERGEDEPKPPGKSDEPKAPGKSDEPKAPEKSDEPPPERVVAQFVVTPESPLVGRSVRQERLVERYRLALVGLRPVRATAKSPKGEMNDRPLEAGDTLLVQGPENQLLQAQHDGIGLLLDARHVLPRQEKAWVAIAVMAIVVGLAATKTVPIALAALAGVLALLLTRVISWHDVGTSLSAKVIMLVTASLALGWALSVTGGTAFLAARLVEWAGELEPRYLLAMLMLLMGLLTNFVSNNASAAIGTPLAVEMALELGVAPEPYVLAVLFGCNLCYLTPMGYQTNLLVMNAAGYRFSDFVRVGTPLFLIMWLGLCAMLVLAYGL